MSRLPQDRRKLDEIMDVLCTYRDMERVPQMMMIHSYVLLSRTLKQRYQGETDSDDEKLSCELLLPGGTKLSVVIVAEFIPTNVRN